MESIGWHPLFGHEEGILEKRPIPKATFHQQKLVHDIDFTIYGDDMQYVELELDPREAPIAEAGAMMYMDSPINMETVFGYGEQSGVVDSLIGAGKRLLSGESLFMTLFTNDGKKKHRVAFAAPYPGKTLPLNLVEFGGEIVCQKTRFFLRRERR
ncbi:MAG: hypothetical protein ACI92E_000641 [Oceanicoccus sp.]|jgi:uncharacterized protein (AIM24 family)